MGQPVVHFEIGCRDSAKTADFFSNSSGGKCSRWGRDMINTGADSGIQGHISSLGTNRTITPTSTFKSTMCRPTSTRPPHWEARRSFLPSKFQRGRSPGFRISRETRSAFWKSEIAAIRQARSRAQSC